MSELLNLVGLSTGVVIRSTPGAGTVVDIHLPIAASVSAREAREVAR